MTTRDPAPRGKLTSTEVTYLLVAARATGRLTVTEHGDAVRITGPLGDRQRAYWVLFDHGLVGSPGLDHDDYRQRTEADQ